MLPHLRRLARCKLPILLLQLLHQVLLGLHGLLGFRPQLVMLLLQLLQLLLQHLSWNTLHTTAIIAQSLYNLMWQQSCLLLLHRSFSESSTMCQPHAKHTLNSRSSCKGAESNQDKLKKAARNIDRTKQLTLQICMPAYASSMLAGSHCQLAMVTHAASSIA